MNEIADQTTSEPILRNAYNALLHCHALFPAG